MSVVEPDIITSCHYYFMIMEKDEDPSRFNPLALEMDM